MQKAQLNEMMETESKLDFKISSTQKELEDLSNLPSYKKYVYITKDDIDSVTQPGELMMVMQTPVGSLFSHCGNEELCKQCEKCEKAIKECLDKNPLNEDLQNEMTEITEMKNVKQFVKIVSPSDDYPIEMITSTKKVEDIQTSQLYSQE